MRPPTRAQERQLHICRVRGWKVEVTGRNEKTRVLHVRGANLAGVEFTGTIDSYGTLNGKPVDPDYDRWMVAL
jgi:hypothetical protein